MDTVHTKIPTTERSRGRTVVKYNAGEGSGCHHGGGLNSTVPPAVTQSPVSLVARVRHRYERVVQLGATNFV